MKMDASTVGSFDTSDAEFLQMGRALGEASFGAVT